MSSLVFFLVIDNDDDADLQEDGLRDSNRAVCTCRKSFQLLSPCSRTALLNPICMNAHNALYYRGH